MLESEIGTVWVEGEISNLARPASGHLYFTLKDDKSQVRCALFRAQRTRLPIDPENGVLVRARARVSLYEPRGEFQLIVDMLEPAGLGELQRQFETLKLKLLNEGLYEQDNKLSLPAFPRRIGVITSPSGAVIHDILTTLKRRFPAVEVLLFPVPVQGKDAAPGIVEALQVANELGNCDALILARGGGSLEDLWAFNEETVARAIFSSSIPIVSSVGHETDFTIADFVADVRAPTPTAAAEMLSPDSADIARQLLAAESRLQRLMRDKILQCAQTLDHTSRRLVHPGQRIQASLTQLSGLGNRLHLVARNRLKFARARLNPSITRLINIRPEQRIQNLSNLYSAALKRLAYSVDNQLNNRRRELSGLAKRLNTLNPLETLGRGFSIFYKEDRKTVVDSVRTVDVGERGYIQVSDGIIKCLIEDLNEEH